MRLVETTYKGWNILFNGDKRLYALMDKIVAKESVPTQQKIKNTRRSLVLIVSAAGQKAVLKCPREKNTRRWIRFTTLYRKGEAFKAISNMDKLKNLGIKSNRPLMAMEKRRWGMVVDSWFVYTYEEGRRCRDADYPAVVKKLEEIHSKKVLHGDPQIDNFLISDNAVITIDSNPKKALFGNISRYYEYFYLQHFAPGIEKYFSLADHTLSYRVAATWSNIYWKWRDLKKHRRKNKNALKKILVIRLSSIGDIILTTPVLSALKKAYPEASIDYLVMKSFKEAISGNKAVDNVILFEKEQHKGILGIYRFSQQLKENQYDLVIDLHSKLRSRLITLFLGNRTLRYKKRSLLKSILVPLRMIRYQVDDTIVRNYFKPLDKIKVYYTSETLTFDVDPEDLEKVTAYKDAVVMAPGAANMTKQWPVEYYAALGNLLQERIVLIGGHEDDEKCNAIQAAIGNRCTNLAGKLSLKQSGALISLAKYMVTNDSGPFHMARGIPKKVFVIFGPTDPGMFTYDENSILIYAAVPCSPCSLHGDRQCPQGHFDCMKLLTPQKVHRIIEKNRSGV